MIPDTKIRYGEEQTVPEPDWSDITRRPQRRKSEGSGKMNTTTDANRIDVVCIGQAVLDCIVRGREEDPAKPNVYRAETIALSTGGDAVNESFNLAQMGYKARLVCGLGDDLAGHVILQEAARWGVDTSCITVTPTLTTPIANLVVSKDGSRHSINSSATMLTGYVPPIEAMAGAKIISFASLFRAPLDRAEVIRPLITAAHETGAIVVCDTKLPTFREVSLSQLQDVLPLIDYIFPNEKEAAYYSGETQYPAMAQRLRDLGIRNVIIKTGPEGVYASLAEGTFSLPAQAVKAVDTTGAGDSFVAGFMSGLLQHHDGEACLQAGLARAAACVQHMGALT